MIKTYKQRRRRNLTNRYVETMEKKVISPEQMELVKQLKRNNK